MWEDANTFDEGEIGQVKLATSDEENKLLQNKSPLLLKILLKKIFL